jgi:tetrapyrrole methylase family protein/MazG family protein
MARLRSPEGCPWDREQDHKTLKPYLLEEAYEVLDAIDAGDEAELCAELGDVLLQVVFHAQVAAEGGRFAIDDVCRAIVDKLVRRHPHVFGDVEVDGADHVVTNWEAIKRAERDDGGEPPSALDGVPRPLPALLRAQRVQEKASRVGFDWERIDEPLDKVAEEFSELRVEWQGVGEGSRERVEEEFGDLLFALVNTARFLKVDPEEALRAAVDKFDRRFRLVEAVFHERGQELTSASLDEMDAVWNEVKERPG